MEVLSNAMNSIYYMYDSDFRSIEEVHKADAREDLVVSLHFLLCDPLYNSRRQSELKKTWRDVLRANDMDNFCDLAKQLLNLIATAICSVVRLSFLVVKNISDLYGR